MTVCAFLAMGVGVSVRPVFGVPAAGQRASGEMTGEIVGVVRWAGEELPESTRVANTTDPAICGEVQSRRDALVSARGGGIENVIVALAETPPETPVPPPRHLVIENRDCQFVPHAAVLPVGSTIEAVSHDAVLHTVHLYGAAERNLALPAPGVTATVTVVRPGLITVLCDVHGWMQAFVRVDPHPYHAVTDEAGGFRIAGVPAGTHRLESFHERFGTLTRPVRVRAGEVEELEIFYGPVGSANDPSVPLRWP